MEVSNGVKQYKFLVACGGTGGHVFPAVALVESIKKEYPESDVVFAGVFKKNIEDALEKSGYKIEKINSSAMPRGFNILILPFLLKITGSFLSACKILKNYRPDIVISMGSFSGGPFVIAAKIMRLPILIHEQNVVPGRANRLSAYFADRIVTSFEATSGFFPAAVRSKIVCTGNPLRKKILDFKDAGNKHACSLQYSDKFTILVSGGSQGSQAVNKVFVEAAENLDKDKFRILHLTGASDFDFVKNEYNRIGIENDTFSFLDDMGWAYSQSGLVICRSGAITISEITAFGLASILIPYPHGDCHQKENANVLKNANAAIIIEEESLTKDVLSETIIKISSDKEKLNEMKRNSRKLAKLDAADNLKKEVLNVVIARSEATKQSPC